MSNQPLNKNESSNGSGGGKKKNANLVIYGSVGGIALVFILFFYIYSDSSKEQVPVESKTKQVTLNDAEKQKGVQQYDTSDKARQQRSLEQRSLDNINDNTAPQKPKEYSVPVNGQQVPYIEDAQGKAYPLDSQEGQQIKATYEQYAVQSGLASPTIQSQQSNALLEAEITRLNEQLNSQTKALDEKLESAYLEVEDMKNLITQQNQTIVSLSNNIKMIQPLTKSSEDLAKEIFGKNGQKVLKSKNDSISASSVVGDKAFLTDKDGNVTVVRVGDVVTGTSLKVLKVDPVANEVIVGK